VGALLINAQGLPSATSIKQMKKTQTALRSTSGNVVESRAVGNFVLAYRKYAANEPGIYS